MESISTHGGRRPQDYPGYLIAEALAELIAGGLQAFGRWLDAAAQAQEQAKARRELRRLSDHYLKDIGLERSQIDQLFR